MKIEEAIEKEHKFILVGCDASKERDGMSELWHVLIKYCNIQPIEAFELPIRGLYLIAITEEPKEIVKQIGSIIEQKKFDFQISRKFVPIERILQASLSALEDSIGSFLERIPDNARWKISVNRRHAKIKRNEIIKRIVQLPQAPKGKVDLTNPDWEIIIELFGKWIGFSVYPVNSDFRYKVVEQE